MGRQQTSLEIKLHGLILVVIVGAWLVGILIASWLQLQAQICLIGVGSAFIFFILLRHDRQGRLVLLLILCLAGGAWRYTIAQPTDDPKAISSFIGTGLLRVRGTVADEPKLQGHGRIFIIEVDGINRTNGYQWQEAHGKLEVQTLSTSLEDPYGANYGDSVEVQGKLLTPRPPSPPGIFATISFPRVKVNGNTGNPLVAFLYHLRITFATIISQSLPQPEAALLIALVLGLNTPALQPLKKPFSITGTAHLIVPSGFKVTILGGIVAGSMQWLNKKQTEKQLPAEKRRDWRRWLATIIEIMSIAGYTVLSGTGAAAIRAGVMGALLVLAPRIGRQYNVYTALAVTALLMSIADPFVLWDVGFQLSFLGTLGIVLLTRPIQRLLYLFERLPAGHLLLEITAVTLAAQIATLPIVAITFHQISFIAPLANILTVPLLGILILLGALICMVGNIFSPFALLFGWIAWPLLRYMDTIVIWCANISGAYQPIDTIDSLMAWGYYLMLAIVVSMIPQKDSPPRVVKKKQPSHTGIQQQKWRLMQLSAAILIIVTTLISIKLLPGSGLLRVSFLSVGPQGKPPQGEAIFIRTPDDKTILIDGGLDASSLAQALDSHLPSWQRSLDAVLLTTTRQDHITGLQDIITRYAIGTVIDAGMLHPNTTYARWRRTIRERNLQYMSVIQGESITIGSGVVLEILWPTAKGHAGSNEVRDNGLIIRLVAAGLQILLLGASAQSPYALAGLMNDHPSNTLQADIVQIVGETNKPVSADLKDILQKVHPSLLVITPAQISKVPLKTVSPLTQQAPLLVSGQSIETALVGTLEISSSSAGWNAATQ